ncbi:MAG: tRNA (adenosine(37)-N6)-threonylcarbamoyltransferase complex dimerization subunit type 1 TsaB [Bradyrhizobium sp.]|nr:MAG: tRNA (adenosine(37)-N6)-threonylcarbamoyltransferase complex dimerization subunit type 1 TsaB [Bradyrhizobium sp.]
MRILVIDTSCGAASVAVLDSATRRSLASRVEPMARGHAEALAPMTAAVIGEIEGGAASLGAIGVTVGPGSFTGIRIGLALARAMGLALEVPVIGVSTLVAFAAPLLAQPRAGIILSAIDARHGAVYFQAFENSGRPLFAPRVGPLRDAIRAIGAGPGHFVGDAAETLTVEARRGNLECEGYPSPYPDINAVALIALAANPATSPPRPIYVKPPDAKPATGEAIARAEG